ncbi:MAG: hypothetical protein J6B98_00195 [Bacilli bacterium]|nr:hypothetical protein [Bacilli bacterium]
MIKKKVMSNHCLLCGIMFLGCEYVLVDVFAYNENAIKFYDKNGYHHRMYTDIKKL